MKIESIKFEWNDKNSIFSSEKYLKSISDKYGWIGGFFDNELTYVLPYVNDSKYGFRYLVFQTGIIDLKNLNSLEKEQIFLNKTVEFLNSKNFDFIKPSITSAIFNCVPTSSIMAEFGSYLLDLSLDEEILWRNIHSKHRNVIRKAQKDMVKIHRGKQYMDISYEMLNNTLKRSNINFYSFQEYKKIINYLGDNIEIFVAEKDGDIHASAVFPFSEYGAYYNWGGSREKASLGSMNLLHWEAIKYFRELGIQRYDFVGARINPPRGSKIEGIQRFKVRFGAKLHVGYLWKNDINFFKSNLYKMLMVVKTLSTKGDIVDQERR